MTRRRHRHDAMAPINAMSWLVERDVVGDIVRRAEELPPNTDPKKVMIGAMARNVSEGWEVEELPGTIPIYFCRRMVEGQLERRSVSIIRHHPANPPPVHGSGNYVKPAAPSNVTALPLKK